MIGADRAFVVSESHLHYQCRLFSIAQWLRTTGPNWLAINTKDRDVKARLPLDLLADFTLALDHDDASQSRPFVAFLKPSYIMDRRVGSGFDATVIAVHRFMPADLGILEVPGFLFSNKNLDILTQCALIAFEREDVIGLLLQDFRSNIALAPHRIDGHDGTLDGHHIEERGMATGTVGPSATLTWPSIAKISPR